MKITIDKSLPIALHTQIVGAIEYSIMAGVFRCDVALPSVRVLSKQLGVAQLTVSHAYQALKEMGLIETIPGKGTYVVRERQEMVHERKVAELHYRFQLLLQDAESIGLSSSFFVGVLNHSASPETLILPFRIAMVGNSNRINLCYIEAIRETLGLMAQIDTYTFQEFFELPQARVDEYGFYLTIPHCIPRLRQRITEETPVYAPYLIPADSTRTQLAALPADTEVLLISRYETFIPAMIEGVRSFAPHLGKISVIALKNKQITTIISGFNVVIYSTGCYSYLHELPKTEMMFEYRHTPEPRYLRETLQPALKRYASL